MSTAKTCLKDVYPRGSVTGYRCGRAAKRDGMCALHLAAHERREAKAKAAHAERLRRQQQHVEAARRETLALNLAQFLTATLGVSFEAAYGGVWLDTDAAQQLLQAARKLVAP